MRSMDSGGEKSRKPTIEGKYGLMPEGRTRFFDDQEDRSVEDGCETIRLMIELSLQPIDLQLPEDRIQGITLGWTGHRDERCEDSR